MSNRLLRLFLTCFLCLALAGMTACGSDDDDGGNGGNGGGTDTGQADAGDTGGGGGDAGDTGGTSCELDVDCEASGAGEFCDPQTSTCVQCYQDAHCASGETCSDANECVSETAQCSQVGQECDPNLNAGDNWSCQDPGDGQTICMRTCTVPDRQAGEEETCQSTGQICLGQSVGGPGVCLPSQCQNVGDTASCQPFVDASPGDYPEGANCVPVGNGAHLCLPAGTLQEGDVCDGVNDSCATGTICGFDGTCQRVCSADADCSGGERCIGETSDQILDQGYGLCDVGCESYNYDGNACPQGTGCLPVTADDGLCQPAGDIPFFGTCDAYQECSTDGDCPSGKACTSQGICERDPQCAGGATCLTFEAKTPGQPDSGHARCYPLCNEAAGDQAAADATCPGASAETLGYARFYNTTETLYDVYVDGTLVADDLARPSGDTPTDPAYEGLTVGAHTIDVVASDATDNSSPIATMDVDLGLNEQWTITINPTADPTGVINGAELAAFPVPRDVTPVADPEVKLRIGIAVADLATALATSGTDRVDVYVTARGADAADGMELTGGNGVAYGEATAFATLDTATLPAVDAYVFAHGADPTTAEPIGAFSDIGVGLFAGETLSVYVIGSVINAAVSNGSLSFKALTYSEAPMTRALGGYCLGLAAGQGQEPTPNSGICFQSCDVADYGAGLCEGESTCTPFRGERHVCWPTEGLVEGEACDPSAAIAACSDGSFCRVYGDGTGECASYCVPSGSGNDALSCASGEACQPIGTDAFDFGQCGFTCTPTDYADGSCPANLQSCFPTSETGPAFCSASADVPVSNACGDVAVNNCEPGAQCVGFPVEGQEYDPINDSLIGGANTAPTCTLSCEPFKADGEASDCPDGQFCAIDFGTLSTETGYCLPATNEVDSLEACDTANRMCGDNAYCFGGAQSGNVCQHFCVYEQGGNGRGCPTGQTCGSIDFDRNGRFEPSQDLIGGKFSICQ